jgi:hypothetical protein
MAIGVGIELVWMRATKVIGMVIVEDQILFKDTHIRRLKIKLMLQLNGVYGPSVPGKLRIYVDD